MKNFIELPRQVDGVKILLNVHKIRVVAPADFGCEISLDDTLKITGVKLQSVNKDSYIGNFEFEHILFKTTTSYHDVLALIELALSE